MPNVPENVYWHEGNGANLVFVAPDQDLVVVARWIAGGAMDEFFAKVIAAVQPR